MSVLCFHAKWAAICSYKEEGAGQPNLTTERREPKFQALSNLVPSAYGLAEKVYQRSKFAAANGKEAALNDAWDELEHISAEHDAFKDALVKLQPGKSKSEWTDAQLNYWFFDGKPIAGILYKLMQGTVPKPGKKQTANQRRRSEAFLQLTRCKLEPEDLQYPAQMSKGEKKSVMLQAMLQKFQGDAARLLLETGNMQLQERVSRGKGRPGDLWSIGPGGGQNLCGECLMTVRQMLAKRGSKRILEITLVEDEAPQEKEKKSFALDGLPLFVL